MISTHSPVSGSISYERVIPCARINSSRIPPNGSIPKGETGSPPLRCNFLESPLLRLAGVAAARPRHPRDEAHHEQGDNDDGVGGG